MPLVAVTASEIIIGLWSGRVIDSYDAAGIVIGPVSRVSTRAGLPRRAKISDLDPLFHDVPRRVKVLRPDQRMRDTDVSVDFSMQRSLRIGSNTQARTKRIPAVVETLNNRWRAQGGL